MRNLGTRDRSCTCRRHQGLGRQGAKDARKAVADATPSPDNITVNNNNEWRPVLSSNNSTYGFEHQPLAMARMAAGKFAIKNTPIFVSHS